MKKQKVIAMLLAGTLTLVQPLSAIASESEFYSEDVNVQETTDALPETLEDSPTEDTASTTEENVSDFTDTEDTGFLDNTDGSSSVLTEDISTVHKNPSYITVLSNGALTTIEVSDDNISLDEYKLDFRETTGEAKTEKEKILENKTAVLMFNLEVRDSADNCLVLSDDSSVNMVLDEKSFLDGTKLYHEMQDGTWEELEYKAVQNEEDKKWNIKFVGKAFGVFAFVKDKEEDLTVSDDNSKADENVVDADIPSDNQDSDNQKGLDEDLTVNEPESTNTFSWIGGIAGNDVNISVDGDKEFPKTDVLQVAEIPEPDLSTKISAIAAENGKNETVIFPVNIKICGEDGIEDSMDEIYTVNLDGFAAQEGTVLYHELLNGSFEVIPYDVSGNITSFTSEDGLGTFLFLKESEKEEQNKQEGPKVSETPVKNEEENKDEADITPTPEAEVSEVPAPSETPSENCDEDENIADVSTTPKAEVSEIPAPSETPKQEEVMPGNENASNDETAGNDKKDEAESSNESADEEKKDENVDVKEDETGENSTLFSFEDDEVSITAIVKPEAEIPETAELQAKKLEEGSDAYNVAVAEVEKSMTLNDNQRLLFIPYDVCFMNAGEKIEPADGMVQVKMEFKKPLFGMSPEKNETFAAHIKNDGTVEKVSNEADEKDSVEFTVDSFSIMGPAMITSNDVSAQAAVEPIIIDSFNVSFSSGAKLTDGKYVWNPTDPVSGHMFVYTVSYIVSGTFSTDKGAFKIELPLHILKDRDGNWADTFDCPYQMESEITEADNPDFVYSINEETNTATIYNYKPYPTGESGFIEFSYVTSKSTLSYTDMNASTNVHAKVYATNEASTVTKEADASPVYIDTHTVISYTEKKVPTLYRKWNSNWGSAPSDADDYLYLVWPIRTYVNKNTSPYNFYLDDTFTSLAGSVVGYKFAGQDNFSETNHVDNLMSYGDRYDYVLTRHSKSEAEKEILSTTKLRYSVHNDITAKVDPVDQVDEDTTAIASRDWWYEEPRYYAPTGHFWAEKYGLYGGYNEVRSSEDITDYTLMELIENDENEIPNIKYYVYGEGYPYPWTLGDGADGTVNDALNGLYGQKKVNYTFTDDTFYVEDTKLNDNDYDLKGIEWNPVIRTATFNNVSYTFSESLITSYNEADNINILVRTNSGWSQAAVYDMQSKMYKNVNASYITSANGKFINFADGIKGVRLTASNAYYHTRFNVYPNITLKRTDNVLNLAGNNIKIRVKNEACFNVSQNNSTLFERTVYGVDYIQKVIRESEIKKDVIQTRNDKKKAKFDVTWRVNAQEKYIDNEGLHYILQESGKFYDLLPAGSVLNPSSITVTASGKNLEIGEYSYELTENFRNSGRTLLTVTITENTKDRYILTYQTSHGYGSISDYGKNLLNSVVYESGNNKIGEGRPDDGGDITDKDILKDIDSDTDANKFLYAEARYTINILIAANTGLKKQIKNSTSSQYSYETTVHLDEDYSYQVRLTNDAITRSKDIIFFDSVESFFQKASELAPTIPSDWKGTITGISVNNLIFKGIKPAIYLSKIDSINIQNHHDLDEVANGENVWIPYSDFVNKYGIKNAKAIAVDASKSVTGSDFILDKKQSISFDVYMKAPSEDVSGITDPIAYNNIYVSRTAISSDGEDAVGISQFFHQDYTKAHYRVTGNVYLKKVDATDMETPIKGITYKLSGTSDYGTEYAEERVSDKNGEMKYEAIEKGTYELREISCSDDWQLNTETYNVTINEKGIAVIGNLTKSGDNYIVSDKPRIHTDIVFLKYNNVTGGMVKNAKFRLSGTSDYGNDYLMYASSNEIGRVDFENVELGTYELSEIEAPSGYIQKKEPWAVKVDERGVASIYDNDKEESKNKTGYYTLINEPYHSIRFVKSSTYGDGIYLEGAEFSLTGVSDYGTSVDMTATSGKADDGGLVVFEGLEPGTYILKETKAPAEHDLNEKPYTVVVNKDGTFTIDGLEKIRFGSKAVQHNDAAEDTGRAVDSSNSINSIIKNEDDNSLTAGLTTVTENNANILDTLDTGN